MEQARCRLSVYFDAVEALKAPIFCAAFRDEPTPSITLHALDTADAAAGAARWRENVEAHLGRAGVRARCKVKRHRSAALERARSIESFLRAVPGPKIVFDPTGALLRMRRLVNFARMLRGTFGPRLTGIYVEAWHRSLYLVFDPAAFAGAADGAPDAEALANTQATVEAMLASAAGEGMDEVFGTVMLGLAHPSLPLVAVDEASPAGQAGVEKAIQSFRRTAVGAAVAAMFGTGFGGAAMAQEADLPAVSQPNLSVSAAGGVTKKRGTSRFEAIGTVPLGRRFGAQVDAHVGNEGNKTRWGVTGYAFWRDPNRALVGIVSSWQQRGSFTLGRSGLQGELYLGDYTLGARIGGQYGRASDGAFGQFEVRWYPFADLKLAAGGDFAPAGRNMAHFGVEYQPALSALPGLAVFADGEVGSRSYHRALFGVRYYFGAAKSLKRRHREDDPMPFNGSESQTLNTQPSTTTTTTPSSYVPVPSDIRLKRDIAEVGRLDNGLGLYRYRYLDHDQVYVGVMAQEVAALDPDALRKGADGYFRVDYARLGIRLRTWEEWAA